MKVVLHIDNENIFDVKRKILSALPEAKYMIFNKDENHIDIPAIKKTVKNFRNCATDKCDSCELFVHGDDAWQCSIKLKLEVADALDILLSEFITKE